MAAEDGDYGDLGSWGLLTVEKRDHEWHEGHEWFFGGGRNAECGLTRPAGLALRAAYGCLPSAISTAFRLSRSARLRIVESGEWRVESGESKGRAEGGGGTEGFGDGAHSSLKLSCPFFAKASNPFFAGGFEGLAALGICFAKVWVARGR
jgi:hypothetical protein